MSEIQAFCGLVICGLAGSWGGLPAAPRLPHLSTPAGPGAVDEEAGAMIKPGSLSPQLYVRRLSPPSNAPAEAWQSSNAS